ncbi:MAG: hypothetical protein K0S07_831 [Chlamydiales bacterium]|nr:hypothetical protein [Chlamydiales bacterium]
MNPIGSQRSTQAFWLEGTSPQVATPSAPLANLEGLLPPDVALPPLPLEAKKRFADLLGSHAEIAFQGSKERPLHLAFLDGLFSFFWEIEEHLQEALQLKSGSFSWSCIGSMVPYILESSFYERFLAKVNDEKKVQIPFPKSIDIHLRTPFPLTIEHQSLVSAEIQRVFANLCQGFSEEPKPAFAGIGAHSFCRFSWPLLIKQPQKEMALQLNLIVSEHLSQELLFSLQGLSIPFSVGGNASLAATIEADYPVSPAQALVDYAQKRISRFSSSYFPSAFPNFLKWVAQGYTSSDPQLGMHLVAQFSTHVLNGNQTRVLDVFSHLTGSLYCGFQNPDQEVAYALNALFHLMWQSPNFSSLSQEELDLLKELLVEYLKDVRETSSPLARLLLKQVTKEMNLTTFFYSLQILALVALLNPSSALPIDICSHQGERALQIFLNEERSAALLFPCLIDHALSHVVDLLKTGKVDTFHSLLEALYEQSLPRQERQEPCAYLELFSSTALEEAGHVLLEQELPIFAHLGLVLLCGLADAKQGIALPTKIGDSLSRALQYPTQAMPRAQSLRRIEQWQNRHALPIQPDFKPHHQPEKRKLQQLAPIVQLSLPQLQNAFEKKFFESFTSILRPYSKNVFEQGSLAILQAQDPALRISFSAWLDAHAPKFLTDQLQSFFTPILATWLAREEFALSSSLLKKLPPQSANALLEKSFRVLKGQKAEDRAISFCLQQRSLVESFSPELWTLLLSSLEKDDKRWPDLAERLVVAPQKQGHVSEKELYPIWEIVFKKAPLPLSLLQKALKQEAFLFYLLQSPSLSASQKKSFLKKFFLSPPAAECPFEEEMQLAKRRWQRFIAILPKAQCVLSQQSLLAMKQALSLEGRWQEGAPYLPALFQWVEEKITLDAALKISSLKMLENALHLFKESSSPAALRPIIGRIIPLALEKRSSLKDLLPLSLQLAATKELRKQAKELALYLVEHMEEFEENWAGDKEQILSLFKRIGHWMASDALFSKQARESLAKKLASRKKAFYQAAHVLFKQNLTLWLERAKTAPEGPLPRVEHFFDEMQDMVQWLPAKSIAWEALIEVSWSLCQSLNAPLSLESISALAGRFHLIISAKGALKKNLPLIKELIAKECSLEQEPKERSLHLILELLHAFASELNEETQGDVTELTARLFAYLKINSLSGSLLERGESLLSKLAEKGQMGIIDSITLAKLRILLLQTIDAGVSLEDALKALQAANLELLAYGENTLPSTGNKLLAATVNLNRFYEYIEPNASILSQKALLDPLEALINFAFKNTFRALQEGAPPFCTFAAETVVEDEKVGGKHPFLKVPLFLIGYTYAYTAHAHPELLLGALEKSFNAFKLLLHPKRGALSIEEQEGLIKSFWQVLMQGIDIGIFNGAEHVAFAWSEILLRELTSLHQRGHALENLKETALEPLQMLLELSSKEGEKIESLLRAALLTGIQHPSFLKDSQFFQRICRGLLDLDALKSGFLQEKKDLPLLFFKQVASLSQKEQAAFSPQLKQELVELIDSLLLIEAESSVRELFLSLKKAWLQEELLFEKMAQLSL